MKNITIKKVLLALMLACTAHQSQGMNWKKWTAGLIGTGIIGYGIYKYYNNITTDDSANNLEQTNTIDSNKTKSADELGLELLHLIEYALKYNQEINISDVEEIIKKRRQYQYPTLLP